MKCATDKERATKINAYIKTKDNWHFGFCAFLWEQKEREKLDMLASSEM